MTVAGGPPTAADRRGAVRVERCMGTVFSLDVRDPGEWTAAFDGVLAWLHRVDAVFSTYRPDSDIARMARGELGLDDADPMVAEVLGLCAAYERLTGGSFSARWSGTVDPTGLVKGWAVEQASAMLRAAGSQRHAVNGGGDVQTCGEPSPGEGWRIGVSDPSDGQRLLAVVAGAGVAVATSGLAERGEHIVDPLTGRPATALNGVTVIGASLTAADAFATAACAMGNGALAWLEQMEGYEALVVSRTGEVSVTSGLHRYLVR